MTSQPGAHSPREPFVFSLLREVFFSVEDQREELQPVSDREFYSILTILVAGLATIALTIGPLAVR